MFRTCQIALFWLMTAAVALPAQSVSAADDKWEPIFDGKTLKNWDGNPAFWSVKDGAITGRTTKENPTKGNTFVIWRGGEVGDFELKLQYKIVGGNSGIQYRSFEPDSKKQKWVVGGYQADIDSGTTYSGINYGERTGRGILAGRGTHTSYDAAGKKTEERFGNSKELQGKIKNEEWNDYHIVAKGNNCVHTINGVKMSELTDNDKRALKKGILALQLHAGPPMVVQFRNIMLKRTGAKKSAAVPQKKKKKTDSGS